MSKIIEDTIKELIIFHGLTEAEIHLLKEKLTEHEFEKNEIICAEGDMGRELFIIISGKVAILKKDSHENIHNICELNAKDSFGEMTLIDVQRRSATVKAVQPTHAVSLSNRSLFEIYKEDLPLYAKIILNIAREFSRRLRDVDKQLVEI